MAIHSSPEVPDCAHQASQEVDGAVDVEVILAARGGHVGRDDDAVIEPSRILLSSRPRDVPTDKNKNIEIKLTLMEHSRAATFKSLH